MSDQSDLRADPIAFGGWLWLFGALIGIDFLRRLFGVGNLYMATSRALASWDRLSPMIKTLLAYDYLTAVGLLIFSFVLLHTLTFTRKSFPKRFNRYMLMAFTVNLVEFALTASVSGLNGMMIGSAVWAAVFIAVFWATGAEYLKKSERVKLTFVS